MVQVLKPMNTLHLDMMEMLALAGLLFWLNSKSDFTRRTCQDDELNKDTRELASAKQHSILRELQEHIGVMRTREEAATRISQLLLLLPNIQAGRSRPHFQRIAHGLRGAYLMCTALGLHRFDNISNHFY